MNLVKWRVWAVHYIWHLWVSYYGTLLFGKFDLIYASVNNLSHAVWWKWEGWKAITASDKEFNDHCQRSAVDTGQFLCKPNQGMKTNYELQMGIECYSQFFGRSTCLCIHVYAYSCSFMSDDWDHMHPCLTDWQPTQSSTSFGHEWLAPYE